MVRPVLVAIAACAATGAAACALNPTPPDAPSSAWSLGPAVPRRALAPGVAMMGQQVVVAGGFDTGADEGLDITARVDAFDVQTSTWLALPDAPVRWTHLNLATVGATLYLLGGLEGPAGVARGEAFELDAFTHRWRPLATMDPGDERGAAGVIAAPGHIFLIGGASSTAALASCLDYDIANDRWSHLPDLPEPLAQPAAMRRIDGTLIVAGGLATLDASAPRGEVWGLTPGLDPGRAWQPRLAMHEPGDPATRGGCAYGVVLGQLVCAGGEGGTSAVAAVETYDPFLDDWTVGEAMPVTRAGTPGAAVGGRLYVPGGADSLSLVPTDTLYVYTPLDTAPR